jgi:hypothetical protein
LSRRWVTPLLFGAALTACASSAANDRADAADGGWFTDITAQSGVTFVHEPGSQGEYWLPESMGSGVAVFDYDGDGDLDIYLVNGAWRADTAGKTPPRNALFRQTTDRRFEDVTDVSGLGDTGYGQGVAVGDYDNDGDLDVYVTNVGPDALYRNNGDGTFTDVTRAAGIRNPEWSTSAAFVDFDLDGWLDVYVANYMDHRGIGACIGRQGRPTYCLPQGPGLPDGLYRNNGNGTFTNVAARVGIAAEARRGLGVVAVDFNDDGWPDIYVANDGQVNNLWISDRGRAFHDAAVRLGAAVNFEGVPEASMGIAVGDAFNDERLHLFLTHLRSEKNTLYRRRGATFVDESFGVGLASSSIPYTGFGTGFIDFDHDGDLDLAVVNGHVLEGRPLVARTPRDQWDYFAEPNLLFENLGTGRFRDVSDSARAFSRGAMAATRGLAFGDLDGDGDIDMVETNIARPARVMRNDVARGHWLIVRAFDPALRRDALGASVTVIAGDRRYRRLAISAYSYASANDPRAHFGLGDVTRIDAIEVVWPGGDRERFPGGTVDRAVTVEKGRGTRES